MKLHAHIEYAMIFKSAIRCTGSLVAGTQAQGSFRIQKSEVSLSLYLTKNSDLSSHILYSMVQLAQIHAIIIIMYKVLHIINYYCSCM